VSFGAAFAGDPYYNELPYSFFPVFLNNVSHSALKDLIQFMYCGEVNVKQDALPAFISTAESLQIKGLTDVSMDVHILGTGYRPYSESAGGGGTAAAAKTTTRASPFAPNTYTRASVCIRAWFDCTEKFLANQMPKGKRVRAGQP